MNAYKTRVMSTIVSLVLLIVFSIPLPVVAKTTEPVLTGMFEAVGSSQPIALDIRDDNTYRLYGGEAKLYFYGRFDQEDEVLTLFMTNSDDPVLMLERDEEGGYSVKPKFPHPVLLGIYR